MNIGDATLFGYLHESAQIEGLGKKIDSCVQEFSTTKHVLTSG